MSPPSDVRSGFEELKPGSHVCWIVDEPATYVSGTQELLRDAAHHGQKPVLFGPEESSALVELGQLASMAVDPSMTFLGGAKLDRDTMFTHFREHTAMARLEGYSGLRVVADMDWIVATQADIGSIVSFELILGRVVQELEATIVCAYRASTFGFEAIRSVLSVHEIDVGGEAPQFRLFAVGGGAWRLSGEVDLAVASTFAAAVALAAGDGDWIVDVSDLEFIDVAGMRQIADASSISEKKIRCLGASPKLRRMWELAGFAQSAPSVDFSG